MLVFLMDFYLVKAKGLMRTREFDWFSASETCPKDSTHGCDEQSLALSQIKKAPKRALFYVGHDGYCLLSKQFRPNLLLRFNKF